MSARQLPFLHLHLVFACCLTACTQVPLMSPAVTAAQASSQRGAQAFSKGDLAVSQREYTNALHVYESLGDSAGRASSLLSLARIYAQTGRSDDALAAVQEVLNDPVPAGTATLITAHGRAAALLLAKGDTKNANMQLTRAVALCGSGCGETGALMVLRARSALLQQQPAVALKLASDALGLLAASTPPVRQAQASAERANALRVQAQAYAALEQHAAAAEPAKAALELDRALGLADRVQLDLDLLAQTYSALGVPTLSQQYLTLAERARAASRDLRGNTSPD